MVNLGDDDKAHTVDNDLRMRRMCLTADSTVGRRGRMNFFQVIV